MRPLSNQALIRGWEWGQNKHALDRALALLALACPDQSWDDLAALSIGQRNLRLLALREQWLGPTLDCFVECPACSTGLEFEIGVADLRAIEGSEGHAGKHELSAGGTTWRFRLPDSRDLAAVAGSGDVGGARRLLIERCVEWVVPGDRSTGGPHLSDQVLSALAERMSDLDPQAAPRFALECEDCGHRWSAAFDVSAFLWAEVSARARRLLTEVHILARAYGWSEADILSMGEPRRQFYLEQAGT